MNQQLKQIKLILNNSYLNTEFPIELNRFLREVSKSEKALTLFNDNFNNLRVVNILGIISVLISSIVPLIFDNIPNFKDMTYEVIDKFLINLFVLIFLLLLLAIIFLIFFKYADIIATKMKNNAKLRKIMKNKKFLDDLIYQINKLLMEFIKTI